MNRSDPENFNLIVISFGDVNKPRMYIKHILSIFRNYFFGKTPSSKHFSWLLYCIRNLNYLSYCKCFAFCHSITKRSMYIKLFDIYI